MKRRARLTKERHPGLSQPLSSFILFLPLLLFSFSSLSCPWILSSSTFLSFCLPTSCSTGMFCLLHENFGCRWETHLLLLLFLFLSTKKVSFLSLFFFFDFCSFLFFWSILWTAWTSSTSCPLFTSSALSFPPSSFFSFILFLSLLPLTSLHILKQRGQNFSGSSSSVSVFLLDLSVCSVQYYLCVEKLILSLLSTRETFVVLQKKDWKEVKEKREGNRNWRSNGSYFHPTSVLCVLLLHSLVFKRTFGLYLRILVYICVYVCVCVSWVRGQRREVRHSFSLLSSSSTNVMEKMCLETIKRGE